MLNLVQNLLQPKTDTFYTELGLLGIDYRQSLLIRNPRIDSVFYYLTLQHNNNNGGFNKSFGVYLSTFSDSLGTIKTLVRNQFLDSLLLIKLYVIPACAGMTCNKGVVILV